MSIMGFEPTKLIQAVLNHDSSGVSRLLASGADVNAGDNQGKTALMWAAETGQVDLVNALIRAGANVNARDVFGWPALSSSAYERRPESVRVLLANGADVNARDKDGKTALQRARSSEVAQILTDAGGQE
ncbi:MAG: ankyrin repeat domain-containing protein [Planctomycetes bacterium]|nr:ankyrin repeat domain-containing protein [Planctomycetota bacterium]